MPSLSEIDQESETSLVERLRSKYEEGGGRAIIGAVKGRFERWMAPSALYWSRLGVISTTLGRSIETQHPAILVLSLPRSGSSWVGITLGSATNALYLREPLTQTHLQVYGPTEVVFEVDPASPPVIYKQAAERAFTGIPISAHRVVAYPQQWRLVSRRRRRLVIKEVNPMAAPWLLQSYHPRVIYLVRHPAAVALSYSKLGWLSRPIGREHGAYQGAAHRTALDSLSEYGDHRIILYEELCANPKRLFQNLFGFGDLVWDASVADFVQERTSNGDASNPASTYRNSQRMIHSWEGQLSERELSDLRAGYSDFGLPWYTSEDDWH